LLCPLGELAQEEGEVVMMLMGGMGWMDEYVVDFFRSRQPAASQAQLCHVTKA
jgi:hypothetical protein